MTNSIPLFDEAVQWSEQLMNAPAAILVYILCIASGYVWKMIRVLPNKFIPLVVMCIGAILLVMLTWAAGLSIQAITRNAVVGFIIGFIAWLSHMFVLKKLETKFGITFVDNKDDNANNS